MSNIEQTESGLMRGNARAKSLQNKNRHKIGQHWREFSEKPFKSAPPGRERLSQKHLQSLALGADDDDLD